MTKLASTRDRRDPLPGGALPRVVAAGWVLFLGLPIAALLVRAAAIGRLEDATAGRAVLDALVLSLVTTAISLGLAVLSNTAVDLTERHAPALGRVR